MNDVPFKLHQEILAARTLRAQIEQMLRQGDEPTEEGLDAVLSGDDLDTIADTLEGEVDLEGQITAALELIQKDLILVEGGKVRLKALQERTQRFAKRIETTRTLIQMALEVSGRERFELDLATVSLGKAAAKLEVTDEIEVPARFFEAQPAKLDRTALGAALRERAKKLAEIAKLLEKKKITDEAATEMRATVDEESPVIPGAVLAEQGKSMTLSWR